MSETANAWLEELLTSDTEPISVHHRVIAILVNRNGKPWLADTLRSVRFQTRSVDELIRVDLSSEDGSEALLTAAGREGFLSLPADTGYSSALRAAEEQVASDPQSVEWLWLIHDDSAPASDALAELLEAADRNPLASVIGAKITDWRRVEHIQEVGSGLTAIGTRFTGLDNGERDQGQHDEVTAVMTVGSAGMLIRRDLWQTLGGFTDELAHFRTDSEFCLRVWESGHEVIVAPRARVRHESATARGLRKVEGHRGTSHFIDRYAGIVLAFSRTPRHWLWLRWILVLLATVVRSVAYLILQDLKGARAETAAAAAAILSRHRVKALRQTAGVGIIPASLRPTFREQLSHLSSEIVDTIQSSLVMGLDWLLPDREHVEEVGWFAALRAALRRPGAILSLVTILIGLVLAWPIFGYGRLVTAAGETMPITATDLLADFGAGWHPIGFGTTHAANPIGLWLAMLSAVFTGPEAAARIAVVFGVWSAGMSAHLALRRLLKHAPTRVWLAAIYAFSPPVLMATAQADLGTLLAATVLPWLIIAVERLDKSWRWLSFVTLLVTLLSAIWPAFWVLVWLVLIAAVLWLKPKKTRILRWSLVPLWSFWLLLPWSAEVVANPSHWFDQFGAPYSSLTPAAGILAGVVAHGPAWWWGGGLALTAIAAYWDKRNRRIQKVIWVSLALVLLVALSGQIAATVWPTSFSVPDFRLAALVATAGLIAILASAVGLVHVRLVRTDFGLLQMIALAIALILSIQSLSSVWTTINLDYQNRSTLTPNLSEEMLRGFTEDARLRTLVLSSGDEAQVAAQLMDGRVPQFAELSLADDSASSDLALAVADWLTKSNSSEVNPLRRFGIGYIAVPFGDAVGRRVAALGGLKRVITARNANLMSIWQVTDVTSRIYVGDGVNASGLEVLVDLDSQVPIYRGKIEPREEDTTLVIAERSVPGWNATLAGKPLERISASELRFLIPKNQGGKLLVSYSAGERSQWLFMAGMGWLILLGVLAPRRRRTYQDEWLES